MSYRNLTELPDGIRQNLPFHAQEIYKQTFNSAMDQYRLRRNRITKDKREAIAHRLAWFAVRRKYKDAGDWIGVN